MIRDWLIAKKPSALDNAAAMFVFGAILPAFGSVLALLLLRLGIKSEAAAVVIATLLLFAVACLRGFLRGNRAVRIYYVRYGVFLAITILTLFKLLTFVYARP